MKPKEKSTLKSEWDKIVNKTDNKLFDVMANFLTELDQLNKKIFNSWNEKIQKISKFLSFYYKVNCWLEKLSKKVKIIY